MTLPANWTSGSIFSSSSENAVEAAVNNLQIEPVAVQNANYTAAAGQLIPVNATAGAVTVTLPNAPADEAQIVVKKIDSSAYAVTVQTQGSDKFNSVGDGTQLSLVLQYQTLHLLYSASAAVWYVVSTDAPLTATDSRYVQVGGALGTPTSGTLTNCTFPTISVANGGTGTTTLTGLVKGTGTTPMTAAVAGTDYLVPGGALGTPSSGTLTNATGLPLSGLLSSAYSTTPTSSTLAEWDSNKNLSANALLPAQTSTAVASANTVTLTIASSQTQIFTGSGGFVQTVKLPTTSINAGYAYTISNGQTGTGTVVVQSSNATTITTLLVGQTATFVAATATPTTPANWLLAFNSSVPVPAVNLPNGITNFNTAVQSQACVANTKYYVTSSNLALPSNPLSGTYGLTANKSTFIWDIAMNKDQPSTGGTFSIILFRGTNGNATDTADVTQPLGTLTNVADNMTLEVQITVTSTASGSSSYFYSVVTTHLAASGTGFGLTTGGTGASHFSGTVGSLTFAAGTTFGIGFVSTGTPTVGIPQVQSSTFNIY